MKTNQGGKPCRHPRPRLPALAFLYIYLQLYRHARPHHVIVKRRPAVFGHEDRLDKEADLIDVVPEKLGDFQLAVAIGGHDDCHVDVAIGVGVTLAVGAVHHDLRLLVEARGYDLLVSSDESEGLVAAESASFIHCVICLVSSIISWQACGVSVL